MPPVPAAENPLLLLWVRFVFGHWWLALILLAAVFLWPRLVRLIRQAGRRFFLGVRQSGITRTPGMLYCADCGAELAPETAGGVFKVRSCPTCAGKWCTDAELAQGLAAKRRAAVDWFTSKDKAAKTEFPCPQCLRSMQCGSFRGSIATTFRCEACGGTWFSRIDWVSFDMGA